MSRRPVPALLAACALAALGGCGADGPPSAAGDAVQRTVERYVDAFAAGDGRTACALLSDDAKAALGASASCPDGLATLRALLPAARRSRLVAARVESVEVKGDRAGVRLSSFLDDDGRPTRLRRVGARWLIDPES